MNLEPIAAEILILFLLLATCAAVAIVALLDNALQKRSAKKRLDAMKAKAAKDSADHAAFMADMRKKRKAHESKIAAMRNTLNA